MAIAAVALFGNLWDRAGEQIDGSTCDAFWLLSAEINSGDDPSAALEQFRLGIRGHNDTEVGRAAEQLARGDTDDPQTLEAVETLADACS